MSTGTLCVRFAVVCLSVLVGACPSSEEGQAEVAPADDAASVEQEVVEKVAEDPRGKIGASRLDLALRPAIYQPQRVIAALDIQPGEIIGDVGAGIGLFAYPLAEAVGSEGTVFATEVDPEKITALNKGKDFLGLENLNAVYVDIDGVDSFYQTQSFDMLFLCAVYEAIGHPQKFFEELRPSLKEETGRLVLVHYRMDPSFTALEFNDDGFGTMLATLREHGSTFPIAKRLDAETQQFVFETADTQMPESIKLGVIASLNKMLDDPGLFYELLTFHVDVYENSRLVMGRLVDNSDRRLTQWLVYELTRTGVLDGRKSELDEDDLLGVRRLNRALIMGPFETQAVYDVLRADRPFYGDLGTVRRTLEQAGYTFVKEHEGLLPYHHVWEFGRAR